MVVLTSNSDIDRRDSPRFHVRIDKKPRKKPDKEKSKPSKAEKSPRRDFPITLNLPGYLPHENEYSDFKHTELFGTIPETKVTKLDILRRPQKTLEQLFRFKKKDIVFLGGPGHGKTEEVILYGMDEVYFHKKRYILSFIINRGAGYTQQQKFNEFSRKLTGGKMQYRLYHRDLEPQKALIRKGEHPYAMLGITPLTFIGSLIHFITHPIGEQEVAKYKSHESDWARTLLSPHFIDIDEVDSFSISTLAFLIPVIRVFKWFNPFMQVIIASATLGNPQTIAKHFFGPDGNYKVLKGTGRRGPLTLTLDHEENYKELYNQKLQEQNERIESELEKFARRDNYTPEKEILFLNHKITMNYEQARRFSRHYEVAHGWLKFKEIVDTVKRFRTEPEKIVLTITTLLQTSFDFPSVSRGLWWGTPWHPRDLIQLLARFNRNPEQQGHIDIILRASNSYENQKAQPENREEFITLLTQQSDVPKEMPWFTLEMLKFWILWGLLVGFMEGYTGGFSQVLEYIQNDLSQFVDQEFLQQQLQTAYRELWREGFINYNDDGKLIPTSTTKDWIFKHVNVRDNPRYKIILQSGRTRKNLGFIEYYTLLRHCLVGQSLYWNGKHYVVITIDTDRHEVYVKPAPLGKHYQTNKLTKTIRRTELLAHDQENEIALVELFLKQSLDDKRLKHQPETPLSPLIHSYSGIFIGESSQLLSFYTVQSVDSLVDHLKKILHIEDSELDLHEYQDPLLGTGVLVLDKSRVKLARLLFDYLRFQANKQPRQLISDLSEEQRRIFRNNLLVLPFAKGMKKLKMFLHKFQVVHLLVADSHNDGTPFCINGQRVDFKEFWRALLFPLTIANTAPVKQFSLNFLGDTFDWSHSSNPSGVQTQFQILVEVLEELQLLDKTVFIRGNHDHSEKYFLWRTPLYAPKKLTFEVKTYHQLPAQTAQQVLKILDRNWTSFFNANKAWKNKKSKFKSKPEPPRYKPKNGEFLLVFTNQQVRLKNNIVKFPKKVNFTIKTRLLDQTDIREVRIIPKGVGYIVEIIYKKEFHPRFLNKNNTVAIDLGVRNLITMVNNNGMKPFVIKGGVVKSINQYYNKERARIQSTYDHQGIKIGKTMQKLINKRNKKINDYFHKTSRKIIVYCVLNDIGTVVIGYNPNWKQNCQIGKKNTQNFVTIPYYKLIQQLEYKAAEQGITVIKQEESHSSKCSFLDNEPIKHHSQYLGQRITRGLFKSQKGTIINADVNGAYNIMKKALLNAVEADRIEDVGLHPTRWRLAPVTC